MARHWQLELNIPQIIMGEFRLHYFRSLNRRWDWGLSAGYRYKAWTPVDAAKDLDGFEWGNPYFLENKAQGFLAGASTKYRMGKKRRSFWQSDLFVRYWEQTEKSGDPGYTYYVNDRNQSVVTGIKQLLGREWLLGNPNERYNLGFSAFVGGGVRISYNEYSIYRQVQSDVYAKNSYEWLFTPSVQLGACFFVQKKIR
ncbi:hypothetical protein [Rurimicrobium arvi]|uniref:DUF3575 domain-containing protein n=1 Tax=Rurimicrobium arvi TaxID=2049916 RepID=A0ABP8MTG7_9BACT